MEKGKTGRYFKYAIGEIILVVIGILIALSINNWNSQRQLRIKEQRLLNQVKQEVTNLLGDIDVDIKVLNLGVESHLKIKNAIVNDEDYKNEMCFDFHWLIKDEYIYPIKAAYDALKDEGLDIIQNDSIKELLQGTYEYVLPRISKATAFYPDLEEFYKNYYHQNFKPNRDTSLVFIKELDNFGLKYPFTRRINGIESTEHIGYIPINYQALKNDSEFQMLLRQSWQYRTFKLSRYNNAKLIIEDLIKAIENEF